MRKRTIGAIVERVALKVSGSLLAACLWTLPLPAVAQSTVWDGVWTNSNWYVPVPNLIAYQSGSQSFDARRADRRPDAVDDRHLRPWRFHRRQRGHPERRLVRKLLEHEHAGRRHDGGANRHRVHVHQRQRSGDDRHRPDARNRRRAAGRDADDHRQPVLVTHWAYMAPYNPATFTPPPPTDVIHADVTSPQWRWTASTTWSLVSQPIFASSNPGTFKITNYNNGYFWGIGVGPQGSAVGNFTLLGSMTPEGNVLFNTLVDGTLTSLSGLITGDPATGAMALFPYLGSGTYRPVSNGNRRGRAFRHHRGLDLLPQRRGLDGRARLHRRHAAGRHQRSELRAELHARRLGHQPDRPARQQRHVSRAHSPTRSPARRAA